VNSDWNVVLHQRNQDLSNSEVNAGAIIFIVERCWHYEKIFGIVSRDLVSIVDTCRLWVI